ncbi:hypothetical protein TVAG_506650 [Trichomonas vaginalis G3]|uniref:DUF3447 domain-containing protein n=1 Tax=Trichomonas vaginalis (strain ATCC PRA-98 / G3) TaxID=412133 RepID=A2GBV9_TRIV3|nr:protein ubiquitination [Trichomonas vaginalis G3]EAX85358.1 hypothetical protein TVAG_506650 [Trichomonas vaginalis G3]KAI5495887.1 protein ubiquitination [Trichomonas vaginalis G3]|eukprot:XP_001298288.1 hypothetical protein [Trichomonas vaginalis G3]
MIKSTMTNHDLNHNAIINLISTACRYNDKYIVSYFQLFEQFCEENSLNKFEFCISGNLEDLLRDTYHFGSKLRYNDPKNEDQNKLFIKDDVEELKLYLKDHGNDLQSIFNDCCSFGAINCFNYLKNFEINFDSETLECAILGRNKTIIDDVLNRNVDITNEAISNAIYIHDKNLTKILTEKSHQKIAYKDCALNFNLELFLLEMMNTDIRESIKYLSVYGLIDLIDDILSFFDDKNEIKNEINEAYLESITMNYVDIVKHLIDNYGVDMYFQNDYETALVNAAFGYSFDCLKFLIEIGYDVTDERSKCDEAVKTCINVNDIEVLKILVDKGVKIKSDVNKTPLIDAVCCMSYECVEFFVELGLDLNEVDDEGQTALDMAKLNESPAICEYLLSKGAKCKN